MNSSKKYDVAFISNGLVFGGAERFSISVINGLHEKGYKPLVILLSNENPLLKELHEGIDVHIMKRSFRYDLSVSWRIKKIITENNISKVFCVETFPFILGKLAFYGNSKVVFYLSLHNSLPISFKQKLFDIFYLSVFNKTDIAMFICQFQQHCFEKYYFFKPKLYKVIYNGIDTARYNWQEQPIGNKETPGWKQDLGLGQEDKTILMVGRISIEKGHKYAISALKILHDKQPVHKTHLVIVGSGDANLKASLEKQVESLKLQKYVHFAGAHQDVRPYLLGADMFTLTSFSETFSLAALEAMACGLPVSLTNVGGAAEMVRDEKTGMLSIKNDPESIAASWFSVLNGHQNKAKIAEYIQNNFSLNKMISEYEEILKLRKLENNF